MNTVWTRRLDKIRELIANGFCVNDIAEYYGVSPSTTSAALRRYGLRVRPEATMSRRKLVTRQQHAEYERDPEKRLQWLTRLTLGQQSLAAREAKRAAANRRWGNI